jgi:hypothetical protein
MSPSTGILAHWYYHVPNLILLAMTGLLVLRLLFFPVSAASPPLRLLHALTAPVVGAVGAITPRAVPAPLVIVLAIAWLFVARVILFAAVSATGVRLSMS